ncbi:sensor histidine kinase [Kibdelosporangium phytohabitans]|uniref:sensor histidine kinase n=1 Tax=Kibdelosporangium phytohabitans TaxID=860235 RepID=UPI0014701E14|nr:sensor histidine kinase [Kibdelosporangium phytohabitans]MBE1465603.1 signal transduction histidine kinase [Kibdelosporangium phytohabitans]
MRALSLWVLTALPVLWAVVTSLPGRLPVWEAVAYLVVLAACVALVRRRPVVVLVVALAAWQVCFFSRVSVGSTVSTFTLSFGLITLSFLAGKYATAGHHGAVALAVAVGTGVIGGLVSGGADTSIAAVAGAAVFAVLPWSGGRYRRRYAEMIEAGWDRAEQSEREADQARTRERARLAAEMHDLVGHELAQAALTVGALEVSPSLPADQRAAARAARASVTAASERLADAVRLLRAEEDDAVESFDAVIDRARESGLAIDVTSDGIVQPDAVIARTIHRVLTEALTNVIKHAPGASVAVSLRSTSDGIDLDVINEPAQRPASATGSGYGLLGLAERVTLVGGRFDAGPRPQGGFAVTAHLPDKPVLTPSTSSFRRLVEQRVRHSARRTVLLAAGISGALVISVLGYLVFDAVTSTLDPADYERLRVGQAEAEISGVLPQRTRVDNADHPNCRHYGTHINPFDERRLDLYRLCFRDGVLVDKALLVRGP